MVLHALRRARAGSAYFYKHRALSADLDFGRDVVPLYREGFMTFMRGARTKSGARVEVLLPARISPEMLAGGSAFERFMRFNLYVFPLIVDDEDMQRNGFVILEDFADFSFMASMRMQRAFTSEQQAEMFAMMQDVVPMRMRGIYLVRQPWYVSLLLAVVRPFMKRKLRERIAAVGEDTGALREFFEPDQLPARFGGGFEEHPDAFLDELREREAALRAAGVQLWYPPDDAAAARAAAIGVGQSAVQTQTTGDQPAVALGAVEVSVDAD